MKASQSFQPLRPSGLSKKFLIEHERQTLEVRKFLKLYESRQSLGIPETLFSERVSAKRAVKSAPGQDYLSQVAYLKAGFYDDPPALPLPEDAVLGSKEYRPSQELFAIEQKIRTHCGVQAEALTYRVCNYVIIACKHIFKRRSVHSSKNPKIREVIKAVRCIVKNASDVPVYNQQDYEKHRVILASLESMYSPRRKRKRQKATDGDILTMEQRRRLTLAGAKAVVLLAPFFLSPRRWKKVGGRERKPREKIISQQVYQIVSRLLSIYSFESWQDNKLAHDRLKAAYKRLKIK